MSSCDNCKFAEWCKIKEDVLWCVQKSERNIAYRQGRADKYREITSEYMLLTEKQVEEIRADAIDEIKELIKVRLIDNLGIEDATKYGNKNASQQANSYATVMKYEIADCVDDLLDDLEQLKEQDNG